MASCDQCCLKTCSKPNRNLTSATDRADVRAFQVSANEVAGLNASWQSDGEASFHIDCWRQLVDAVKRKPDTSIQITELEKNLITEASKTVEYHDSDEMVEAEAKRVAEMLKSSKYAIAFTGAGISTAAGIGDFRGKDGKWTNRDKEKAYGAKGTRKSKKSLAVRACYRPTYTHEALAKLLELGFLKYLISQNTDGLHRLSGIPPEKISELHGNAFEEKCEKCDTRYDRSLHHEVKNVPPKLCARCRINHRTGGICPKRDCGGYLMNTIINFGDYLESHILERAHDEASKNDLVLCLGTTLQVSPANDLVTEGHDPVRLVICNRQRTDYDKMAIGKDKAGNTIGSRVFGDCDRLMRLVMKNILCTEDLQAWENERDARMVTYDLKRKI